MKGTILDFNAATGQGEISGDDGNRYSFSVDSVRSENTPTAGRKVDFQVNASGMADGIYYDVSGSAGSKSKIVAALLAFFLGGLGVHKFYLGKTTAGIIMLAVFLLGFILFGIPSMIIGLIAFIEFIIYLIKSDEDFEAQYVQGDKAWF